MVILFVIFSGFIISHAYDRTPHKMEVLVEKFKFGDYYFVFYSKGANWAEAYTICQATHSRLAVVNTPERAKFLGEALSQTKTGFEDVWIGGRFSKDTWQWVPTGKSIASPSNNFPPWLHFPTKRGKNCLSLDRKNHWEPIFVELKCNLYRPFVCEESVSGAIDKFPEGANDILINKRRYFLYHARVTWQEALAFCKQSEARLATIPDIDTANKLVDLMRRARPPFENVWIGAKRDYLGWVWVPTEQELANKSEKGFPPWRFDSPIDNMKSCVILDHHPCLNPFHVNIFRVHRCEEPLFIEEQCSLKKDFLCEVAEDENNEEIKPNLVTIDKVTYIFYEEPLTWVDALFTCEETNMTLVMPETPRQWETIITHMADMPRELYHVWLGGRWLPDEWLWINSQPIPLPDGNSTFSPWCLSMQIHEEDEDCLNLDRDAHNTPLIYGFNCSVKQPFICQLEGEDYIDTPSSSTSNEFQYHSNKLTHSEAERDCQLNHSHLALVNNSDIAQKVAVLLPRDTLVWIGAKRSQGEWKWLKTKEKIPPVTSQNSYPPWEDAVSILGEDVCLAMKAGFQMLPYFVERPCKEKLNYLCQQEKKQLPQPDTILDFNEAKYYFYTEGVTWNEALSICSSGDLYLANVGNLELAKFLIDEMIALMGLYSGGTIPLWTSGKQLSPGSWLWTTSNSKIPNEIKHSYPPWADNTVPTDMEHACLQLNKSAVEQPTFEGENCLQNHSFVCVDKIIKQNETEVEFNNKTISIPDFITNIRNAKKVCLDAGKTVMDVTKLEYNNILKLMKTENFKSVWLDVIRSENGKWVFADTGEEFKTEINFPEKDSYHANDQKNCLTLQTTAEEKLIFVPSLCGDFSRMICVSEVNETHVVPPRVEHVVNESTIITTVLENRIVSHSVLVCNDLGGEIIKEELLQESIKFFKTLDEEYKTFWIDATYIKDDVFDNTDDNYTNLWKWNDGTPVNLEGLPDASQIKIKDTTQYCLIYNRTSEKFEAVSCDAKHSTMCEKSERKCEPKKQNDSLVTWSEKCTKGPVSGGTVCRATCPPNANIIGREIHVCSKGKWSYDKKTKCEFDTSHGKTFDILVHEKIITTAMAKTLFLFVLDYGVPKPVFLATLQFTKNLANTILLSNDRSVSIEMYSYMSKTIDMLENNNCYLIHTVDELEKKHDRSNSVANYHGAFVTAANVFNSKDIRNGFIFFFALRPDKGSMDRSKIIASLKENGTTIIVISVGNDVSRSTLEEIASIKYDALQLYTFQNLKGLIDAGRYLKKKRKFTLHDCPRVGLSLYGK